MSNEHFHVHGFGPFWPMHHCTGIVWPYYTAGMVIGRAKVRGPVFVGHVHSQDTEAKETNFFESSKPL